MRQLFAWMHDTLYGVFTEQDGLVSFRYELDVSEPISISLPFSGAWAPDAPKNFLDGLLPDSGNERLRMKIVLGANSDDAFDLLDSVDAIGGLTFSQEDKCPELIAGYPISPVSEEDFRARLDSASISPDAWWVADKNSRFSLAGTQSKFSIAKVGNDWFWPNASLPSTHIVKPECPPNRNVAVVESATLDLARLCGLQVCGHAVVNAGENRAFITSRFDRRIGSDGLAERLRVEDFTQSLGVSRDAKYDVETETVIAMLRRVDPTCMLCYDWLAQFAFNVMVCNADAHAKNYSLLLEGKKVKLSPLYDSLATWYWPQYSKALAMSVNDVWFTNEVALSDWEALARQNGLAIDKTLEVVKRIAAGVAVYAQLAFKEVPGLADTILKANSLLFGELGV